MKAFSIKSNVDPDILAFMSGWNRGLSKDKMEEGKAEGYKRGFDAARTYLETGKLPEGITKLGDRAVQPIAKVTTREDNVLIEEATLLHRTRVNGIIPFSSSDLIYFEEIRTELLKRGYQIEETDKELIIQKIGETHIWRSLDEGGENVD